MSRREEGGRMNNKNRSRMQDVAQIKKPLGWFDEASRRIPGRTVVEPTGRLIIAPGAGASQARGVERPLHSEEPRQGRLNHSNTPTRLPEEWGSSHFPGLALRATIIRPSGSSGRSNSPLEQR